MVVSGGHFVQSWQLGGGAPSRSNNRAGIDFVADAWGNFAGNFLVLGLLHT